MEGVVNPATTGASTAFWAGKRVLVTGHTGFKGSWLSLWLMQMGARVTGLSLAPVTQPNLFDLLGLHTDLHHHVGDIRDGAAVRACVAEARPEVVFHLAAQALVRESYRQPEETWSTNVQGTVTVLDALRGCPHTRSIVVVTTDKVYQNREWCHPYRETDPLGGHDPYSASKAACEAVAASYRSAFFAAQGVALSTARAGNVIGGGDWSADRLLPDAVRAWTGEHTLSLRNPQSVRPWQHVLEPLWGYLELARQTHQNPLLADAYNFGPYPQEAVPVGDIVRLAHAHWPGARARFEPQPDAPHEAGLLRLDISKAHSLLGVAPRWSLPEAVAQTALWYAGLQAGESARALCVRDLAAFARPQAGETQAPFAH